MIKAKNNTYWVLWCLICFSVIPIFSCLEQKSPDIESPKASSGEIEIISPENISYSSAMSGYFPATFGFESDLPRFRSRKMG